MLDYSTINEIVRLGKKGYSIQAIARLVKASEEMVENLLKMKLENYEEYFLLQNLLHDKQEIKDQISAIINEYGAATRSMLFGALKKKSSLKLSNVFIEKLVGEMVNENKLKVKIPHKSTKYYYTDIKALNYILKKTTIDRKIYKLKTKISLIIDEYTDAYNLNSHELIILKSNLLEVGKLLVPFKMIGYSSLYFIRIANELHFRKHIYLLLKQNKDFDTLKSWLKLYEISAEKNHTIFHGFRSKTYKKIKNIIIKSDTFCNKNERLLILNTPPIFLRLEYLLWYFEIRKKLAVSMLNFIKECLLHGYKITSKKLKGILAGVFYTYAKKYNVRVKLVWITKKFQITVSTFKKRKSELVIYLDLITAPDLKEIIYDQIKENKKKLKESLDQIKEEKDKLEESENLIISKKKSFDFIDEKLRKVLWKEIKRKKKLERIKKTILNIIPEKRVIEEMSLKERNEKKIPFSKRMKNIRSLNQLFYLQTILDEYNSDADNVMYYLMEQTERNIDVYSAMIDYRFSWTSLRTLRVIERLVKKGLAIKIDYCSECGRKYKRIPEICENPDCSKILIRQKGVGDNKLKQPHFLIGSTKKGLDYVNKRINGFHVALHLFSIRINRLQQKQLDHTITEESIIKR